MKRDHAKIAPVAEVGADNERVVMVVEAAGTNLI